MLCKVKFILFYLLKTNNAFPYISWKSAFLQLIKLRLTILSVFYKRDKYFRSLDTQYQSIHTSNRSNSDNTNYLSYFIDKNFSIAHVILAGLIKKLMRALSTILQLHTMHSGPFTTFVWGGRAAAVCGAAECTVPLCVWGRKCILYGLGEGNLTLDAARGRRFGGRVVRYLAV